MPTYMCTTLEGRLSAEQKARIAREVTKIHCEVTGAPDFFAQVIFHEIASGDYLPSIVDPNQIDKHDCELPMFGLRLTMPRYR